jgi:hypothetical protein
MSARKALNPRGLGTESPLKKNDFSRNLFAKKKLDKRWGVLVKAVRPRVIDVEPQAMPHHAAETQLHRVVVGFHVIRKKRDVAEVRLRANARPWQKTVDVPPSVEMKPAIADVARLNHRVVPDALLDIEIPLLGTYSDVVGREYGERRDRRQSAQRRIRESSQIGELLASDVARLLKYLGSTFWMSTGAVTP